MGGQATLAWSPIILARSAGAGAARVGGIHGVVSGPRASGQAGASPYARCGASGAKRLVEVIGGPVARGRTPAVSCAGRHHLGGHHLGRHALLRQNLPCAVEEPGLAQRYPPDDRSFDNA